MDERLQLKQKVLELESLMDKFPERGETIDYENAQIISLMETCCEILKKDYDIEILENKNCSTYPSSIPIILGERSEKSPVNQMFPLFHMEYVESQYETSFTIHGHKNNSLDDLSLPSQTYFQSANSNLNVKRTTSYNQVDLLNSDPFGEIITPGSSSDSENGEKQVIKVSKLKESISKSCQARVRNRFPVPVINFKGVNICRSSTLADEKEVVLKQTCNWSQTSKKSKKQTEFDYSTNDLFESTFDEFEEESEETGLENSLKEGKLSASSIQRVLSHSITDKIRENDAKLLAKLGVKSIYDLMVEQRKQKLSICFSSSEKADAMDTYQKVVSINSVPYPGCEFFKKFKSNFCGRSLHVDWNEKVMDAKLSIVEALPGINWKSYQEWTLNELTANYLKTILYEISRNVESEEELEKSNFKPGILIHCITGWDRTPLFISLIRLSLWADGEIHQSLSAEEMLFFTIAYDWLLFGHMLNDRVKKGEEIFCYCFYFLQFMLESDFSIGCIENEKSLDDLSYENINSYSKSKSGSLRSGTWEEVCGRSIGDTGSYIDVNGSFGSYSPGISNKSFSRCSCCSNFDMDIDEETKPRKRKLLEVIQLFQRLYINRIRSSPANY